MSAGIPKLDLSIIRRSGSPRAASPPPPQSPLDSLIQRVRASSSALFSPPAAPSHQRPKSAFELPPLSPRSPRSPRLPEPETEGRPDERDFNRAMWGLKSVCTRPLWQSSITSEQNAAVLKKHNTTVEPLQRLKEELTYRYGLGTSPAAARDETVITTLAYKQIKAVATLSRKMGKELDALEKTARDPQVLNSPRPLQPDITVQHVVISTLIANREKVIQAYIPQFLDIASTFLEAIDALPSSPRSSRPTGPKTPRQ